MSHEIFEQAKPILKRFKIKVLKAYWRGSVRDYIMQRPIHDVDITTSATPDEIESIFDKTIPVGKNTVRSTWSFKMTIMKLLHSER